MWIAGRAGRVLARLHPFALRKKPTVTRTRKEFATVRCQRPSSALPSYSNLRRRFASNQILGANIPFNKCGWDFGYTYWWSYPEYPNHGYSASFFETAFADLERMQANTARLWVFFDGRSAPHFSDAPNKYDSVIGLERPLRHEDAHLTQRFLKDFLDMLGRAKAHGIQVMPVLWSFEAMHNKKPEQTAFYGGHKGLFSVPACADDFVSNALNPLLDAVEAADLQDTVIAWDIINEPEWAITESAAAFTDTRVSLSEMQCFVGKCAAAIHRKGALATVGSARSQWNWENHTTAATYNATSASNFKLSNFWSDSQLKAAAGGDELAYLDIYQVHYYDHMGLNFPLNIFSFEADKMLDDASSNRRPLLLGEIPGKYLDLPHLGQLDFDAKAQARVKHCKDNGYAGILFWTFENGNFESFQNAARTPSQLGSDGQPVYVSASTQ